MSGLKIHWNEAGVLGTITHTNKAGQRLIIGSCAILAIASAEGKTGLVAEGADEEEMDRHDEDELDRRARLEREQATPPAYVLNISMAEIEEDAPIVGSLNFEVTSNHRTLDAMRGMTERIVAGVYE